MGKGGSVVRVAGQEEVGATPTHACPVLVTGEGRGSRGKTRAAARIYERALVAGRRVRLLDLDSHSPAASSIYPSPSDAGDETERRRREAAGGAVRPISAERDDVKACLEWGLNSMAPFDAPAYSVVVDIGGGESTISDISRDLNLGDFCADIGAEWTRLLVIGPDPQDFQHVVTALDHTPSGPFRPVLVCNEGLVDSGRHVANAFAFLEDIQAYKDLVKAGMKRVRMPRLACMNKLVEGKLPFSRVGELGPFAIGQQWRFDNDWFAQFEREGVALP